MTDLPPGCVNIACTDYSQLVFNTDDKLYEMHDHLAACGADDRKVASKCFGLKYNPFGIMSDPHLRQFYLPTSHVIRDWMHMMVSGGVANVQAARLLAKLNSCGISLTVIGTFIEQFTLPHRLGKTSASWVSKNRLGKKKKSLASFASTMLTLIPIITCFLLDTVDASHELFPHAQCW